jgi:hypothetical protein
MKLRTKGWLIIISLFTGMVVISEIAFRSENEYFRDLLVPALILSSFIVASYWSMKQRCPHCNHTVFVAWKIFGSLFPFTGKCPNCKRKVN